MKLTDLCRQREEERLEKEVKDLSPTMRKLRLEKEANFYLIVDNYEPEIYGNYEGVKK